MNRLRFPVLALVALLAHVAPASAQTYPVDDSASQVLTPGVVDMRWDSLVPRPGQPSTITGQVVVRVVLDVSPWRGRRGRIYHTLGPSPSGPVTARWTADGPLSAGVVRDGGRTLVYAGPIVGDRLTDTFRLTLQADGDRVLRPQSLAFGFEIELDPTP
jgi:hypothetical protein